MRKINLKFKKKRTTKIVRIVIEQSLTYIEWKKQDTEVCVEYTAICRENYISVLWLLYAKKSLESYTKT